MRTLNIIEIENKIISDSNDIYNSERIYAQDKITQFLNFLQDQPISRRILERINEDFSVLKNQLPLNERSNSYIEPKIKNNAKAIVKTRYDQGAFGFFIIKNSFDIERKSENHYFEASATWYQLIGTSYNDRFECFKENFFKPFVDLLQWYIYDSQVRSDKDYYSKNEIIIINDKLDKILATQTASSEIIFDEIGELKELILTLNKKNWVEIFREKLRDAAFGEILTSANFIALVKYISENKLLLNL